MLIPSIDIMNGRAVQLKQGKTLRLISEKDPLEIALEYSRYGVPAVIDLNAAMGTGNNLSLVKEICRRTGARAGGGIRSRKTAMEILRAGASRIILGTALWEDFVLELPRSMVQAAVDTRNGKVMTNGWRTVSEKSSVKQMEMASERASSILCTIIENEGTMKGLPPSAVSRLRNLTDLPLTVAGGVRDTANAVEVMSAGVDVQVGMSLYSGRLNPAEAVASMIPRNSLTGTVVEDSHGQVIMFAWSNRESLMEALSTGQGVYWSRSRKKIWRKGETSGNTQELIKCRYDCDGDTILFTVRQNGFACHTGSYSCFGERHFSLEWLRDLAGTRRNAANSYTSNLLDNNNLLLRKVMEEAFELVMSESREDTIWEAADLAYFITVLLENRGCTWEDVLLELQGRSFA